MSSWARPPTGSACAAADSNTASGRATRHLAGDYGLREGPDSLRTRTRGFPRGCGVAPPCSTTTQAPLAQLGYDRPIVGILDVLKGRFVDPTYPSVHAGGDIITTTLDAVVKWGRKSS